MPEFWQERLAQDAKAVLRHSVDRFFIGPEFGWNAIGLPVLWRIALKPDPRLCVAGAEAHVAVLENNNVRDVVNLPFHLIESYHGKR